MDNPTKKKREIVHVQTLGARIPDRPTIEYPMPVRPPTVTGMKVIAIKPFYVECGGCGAHVLVDGAGTFICATPGCNTRVIVS